MTDPNYSPIYYPRILTTEEQEWFKSTHVQPKKCVYSQKSGSRPFPILCNYCRHILVKPWIYRTRHNTAICGNCLPYTLKFRTNMDEEGLDNLKRIFTTFYFGTRYPYEWDDVVDLEK